MLRSEQLEIELVGLILLLTSCTGTWPAVAAAMIFSALMGSVGSSPLVDLFRVAASTRNALTSAYFGGGEKQQRKWTWWIPTSNRPR